MTPRLQDDILFRGNRIRHLLYTQQFSRNSLDELFRVAERCRGLDASRAGARVLASLLPHKRALLYFVQPSTRTFLSFRIAASILGMSTSDVRSPETSSEVKGETPADSVHIFSVYHDLIVIRYPEPGFAESCVAQLKLSEKEKHIVNAGSGMDQHPTQALLDVYTLHREFLRFGGIDGKRVLIVGDLARGRAARSLIYLLGKYSDVQIDLVSPAQLRLSEDMKEYMSRKNMSFRESDDMEEFLGSADAVYMTRVQDEYDSQVKTGRFDLRNFCLDTHRLRLLKVTAPILHPLPRRGEIPTEIDADPRAVYWDQVENGLWVRVALIAHMFAVDDSVMQA